MDGALFEGASVRTSRFALVRAVRRAVLAVFVFTAFFIFKSPRRLFIGIRLLRYEVNTYCPKGLSRDSSDDVYPTSLAR
jgi:hypothetical protein